LQANAQFRHANARSKPFEDAAHQGDGKALAINNGGAHGIAGRIGDGVASVFHAVTGGFDHLDHAHRIVHRQVQCVECLKRLEHADAMSVGRAFENFDAFEHAPHRNIKKALMRGKVFDGQKRAARPCGSFDRLCRRTFVKRIRAVGGDGGQKIRQCGIGKTVSGLRDVRATIYQV